MPLVLEGLVSTCSAIGGPHLAPMGPHVPAEVFDRFTLRPFPTAQTYHNLKTHGEGVLHVTDDVLLLAERRDRLGRARHRSGSRRTASAVGCCAIAAGSIEFRVDVDR